MERPACPPPMITVSKRSASLLLSIPFLPVGFWDDPRWIDRRRASPEPANPLVGVVVRIDHRCVQGRYVRCAQARPCSTAKAVAAARDETPSLAKMFWRCRATVCSLTVSAAATSRLVLPAATRWSTSTSRTVSPPGRAAGPASRSAALAASAQEPSAAQAAPRVAGNRQPECAKGGLGLALGQAEQGQAGLRVEAQLVRPGEGLLGAGEVADAAADLSGLVEGVAGGPRVEGQLLRGPLGLGLRVRPGPTQVRRLDAVQPAEPGKRGVLLQRLAPRRGRLVPFGGAGEVGQLQADGEDVAVDHAAEVRVQL